MENRLLKLAVKHSFENIPEAAREYAYNPHEHYEERTHRDPGYGQILLALAIRKARNTVVGGVKGAIGGAITGGVGQLAADHYLHRHYMSPATKKERAATNAVRGAAVGTLVGAYNGFGKFASSNVKTLNKHQQALAESIAFHEHSGWRNMLRGYAKYKAFGAGYNLGTKGLGYDGSKLRALKDLSQPGRLVSRLSFMYRVPKGLSHAKNIKNTIKTVKSLAPSEHAEILQKAKEIRKSPGYLKARLKRELTPIAANYAAPALIMQGGYRTLAAVVAHKNNKGRFSPHVSRKYLSSGK